MDNSEEGSRAPSPPPSEQPFAAPGTFRDIAERFRSDPRWFDQTAAPPRVRLSLERGTLLVAAVVFGSGLVASIAAITATFRIVAPLLWLAWIIVVAGFIAAAATRRIRWEGERADLIAVGIALLMALSAGAFHHHYYASQADIGFYVSDATATATTGSRVLHGPFDGLLPGFETSGEGARASAMFGYSSLAAMFAYAFGMFATPWVNAPLAFIALLALYRVARTITGPVGAVIAILLWSTSILTVWMSRWTMTENAAIPAFWVAVLLALSLWRQWDAPRAVLLFLVLLFGALVRPDGILVFVWFALVIAIRTWPILLRKIRALASDPRLRKQSAIAALVAFIIIVPLGFLLARALPLAYLRAGAGLAAGFFRHGVIADSPDVPTTGPSPHWGDYALRFEWDSALAYHLPWILLVGIVGVALRLAPWRRVLTIALLCVPYLLFVFMPPVTTAHPWFMRRLWIALIPFTFLLAGAALDVQRVVWRWPEIVNRRSLAPRPILGVVPVVLILLFLGLQTQMTLPLALQREQDSVAPATQEILPFLPEGAAVILDEDVVEYASAVRFHHDGPVVSWFNQRRASFFASFEASESAPATVIARIAASNRNIIDVDSFGATDVKRFDTVVENTARRDFRNYIANPPMEQGYAPFTQYLETDVPPTRWTEAPQPVQLLLAAEPLFLIKNIQLAAGEWQRTENGLEAVKEQSGLLINLSRFRPDVLESIPLHVHIVYVQTTPETYELTAPGRTEPIGTFPSDGSGTLRQTSIPLPLPLTHERIELPQGFTLRGVLMDL